MTDVNEGMRKALEHMRAGLEAIGESEPCTVKSCHTRQETGTCTCSEDVAKEALTKAKAALSSTPARKGETVDERLVEALYDLAIHVNGHGTMTCKLCRMNVPDKAYGKGTYGEMIRNPKNHAGTCILAQSTRPATELEVRHSEGCKIDGDISECQPCQEKLKVTL